MGESKERLELVRTSWKLQGWTRTCEDKLEPAFVSRFIPLQCYKWSAGEGGAFAPTVEHTPSWGFRGAGGGESSKSWRTAVHPAGPCLHGGPADQCLALQWSSMHKNVFCFTCLKSHKNFSLTNPNLESYTEGNSGKCSSILTKVKWHKATPSPLLHKQGTEDMHLAYFQCFSAPKYLS